MSRVDSLPDGAKELLQIGSVLGREFSYELLQKVTEISERDLLSRISALKDTELIYERGIYPESAFIFKHALTQEVVYDSILNKRKKILHEKIGKTIEAQKKENIDEYYEILAEHFIKSENYEKGAQYFKFSTKKAEKTASLLDAIASAEKRIICLERQPQTDDVQKMIIDTRTVKGLYLTTLSLNIKAKDAVAPIVELALKRGYKKRLCQIYTIIGAYNCWIEEDVSKAIMQLEDALKISEEVNDLISIVFANTWLGLVSSFNCEFEKSLSHFQNSLGINKLAKNLSGIAILQSNIALCIYFFTGKMDLSYQISEEAIQNAHKSGDILSKSEAYGIRGTCCYGKGFLEEAVSNLLKGIDLYERINLFAYNAVAQHFLGEIYFENGEYQKSKSHYIKAATLYEQNKLLKSWVNLNKIAAERSMLMSNEKNIDLESLYGYADEIKIKLHSCLMKRYIAEILLNIGDHHISDAEDWIKQAIEANQKNGMMFELARDYALYADLFKRKNDIPKAKEKLIKAIEIFKECGADGWVEKYEKELAAM